MKIITIILALCCTYLSITAYRLHKERNEARNSALQFGEVGVVAIGYLRATQDFGCGEITYDSARFVEMQFYHVTDSICTIWRDGK